MTAPRILLIDDDLRLAALVGRYLQQAGLAVHHEPTARAGLEALREREPALVLLDLMLPDADGLDVCRTIRALPAPLDRIPVIMLTARGDTTDRIVGLELGADDYLPKPFEPRELLARVRARLRWRSADDGSAPAAAGAADSAAVPERFSTALPPARAPDVLRFGRLEIDLAARQVRLGGEERTITAHQFGLLLALAQFAGRVMSRDQLMDAVRGEALEAFDRSIDVHIGRIRQAIEDDPRTPRRILTIRGAGYLFARRQD